jgi:Zn-dependent protease with chaperone function
VTRPTHVDFFARQDQARKSTKLLVFYFVVAVVLIVACVYFAALFLFQGAANYRHHGPTPVLSLWNPQIFMYAAAGTLLIIVGGSVVKIAGLSSGGSAVAESLGGRLLDSNARDPHERKLLNVVEEMAIASGVPVPQVYVMDEEQGINAFAAGHTINDAAIGVTRGCITQLKRDELQGVIAHEFSHILNGDMRINLRLMGIIFGILCLAVIGRALLRVRGSSREKNPLPLFGIVLLILGWVGVFFGQLIQAAVSRQREFLADAAAVQFTRNPDGIGGALKKIGGAHYGSQIENEHASEASHMFFGNALKSSIFNAFATHPPLEQRIRAIDPHWDGKFSAPTYQAVEEVAAVKKPAARSTIPPIIPGFPAGAAGLAGLAAPVDTKSVLPEIGNPTPKHLRYAVEFRESLSDAVRDAAHDPRGACALLLCLVLNSEDNERQRQLEELTNRVNPETHHQITILWPEIAASTRRARLPLVNLALPALRQLSPREFQQFLQALNWVIESDEQIVLFEFMLQKIVRRQLESYFARNRPAAIQYYSMKPLASDCEVLLSALAHTGQTDLSDINRAFQAGAPHLRLAEVPLTLLTWEQCDLDEINRALDRLAQAAPQIKKNALEACVQTVGADGVIQENEAELLRAIAEALDCPLPPFVAGEAMPAQA